MKHNTMKGILSVFAVLVMISASLAIPLAEETDAASSSVWSYTITIDGNTSSAAVSISGVTDSSGNATENLTSTSTGSWGWDENSEYGPFGSYYAAFDTSGQLMYHVRADDLNTKVGSAQGTNDVDKTYSIMWVLPAVYWKSTDTTLTLTNDSSAGGTAYAHTIDGKVYSYLAIGVYETQLKDSKAMSLSGVSPTASTSRPTFRTASEYTIDTNGSEDDGSGYAMQWNYYQWALYKYCVFATLGTFNSQSFAGGPTSGNSASSTTGLTNVSDTAMPSGYYTKGASDTKSSVRLFLENAWGSLYEWVDNTYVNSYVWYVGQTHNASDNSTDKTNIGTMPSSSGSVSVITTADSNWGLPAAVNGSSTTGTCDYYFQNSGERSVSVGGCWSDVSIAGVSCVYADNSLSGTSSGVGSRLSFVFDADPASTVASGYTVTYNANEGSVSPSSEKVAEGGTVTLPTPTRQYWTFTGWYDGNDKVGNAGDEITVTADRTLTAHWTEQMVSLILHCNYPDSTEDKIYKTVAFKINTAPSDITIYTPAYDGYNFLGWYNETDTQTVFDPTAVMTEDKNAYAKWAKTLVLTSQPTVKLISENKYSLSIELGENQTAVWFDTDGKEIGTGAEIEYTFAESGTHVGTVKVTDSADSTVYAVTEWSTDSNADDSTEEDDGVNIPVVIAVIAAIVAAGFIALRRL